jgi:hypothetical protein
MLRRALLAAAVGFGAMTSVTRADGPPPYAPLPQAPMAPMPQAAAPMPQGALQPLPAPTQVLAQPAVTPVAAPAVQSAPCPYCGSGGPVGEAAPSASGWRRPLRSMWEAHPISTPICNWWHNSACVNCWANFNGYGCGSLASEYAFVFGSCRTFYGDQCMKGPPPPAYPGEPPIRNTCVNCGKP